MLQGKKTPADIERKTGVNFWPKGLSWWTSRNGKHVFFTVKAKGRTGARARAKLTALGSLPAPAALYGVGK